MSKVLRYISVYNVFISVAKIYFIKKKYYFKYYLIFSNYLVYIYIYMYIYIYIYIYVTCRINPFTGNVSYMIKKKSCHNWRCIIYDQVE